MNAAGGASLPSSPEDAKGRRWLSRLARGGEWVVLVLGMFGFTYNVLFLALPIWSTGRVALLALTPFVARAFVRSYFRFAVRYWVFYTVSVAVLGVSVIHWLVGGDSTLMSRAYHVLFYTLYGAILFVEVSRARGWTVEGLFGVATVLQSGMVFYSLFSPTYRKWLASVANQLGNISLEDTLRPPGFTNGGGAALSVIQGLGVFALLLCARRATRRSVRLACHLGVLLDLLASLLTGRTGILIGLAAIGLVGALGGARYRRSMSLFVVSTAALIALALPFGIGALRENIKGFDRISAWALEFFVQGTNTGSVTVLRQQYVPPLTDETIAGTGAIIGRGGASASGADSGYIQTYFAVGLPLAILWYSAIFGGLFHMSWQSTLRRFLVPLVLLMMIVELKEPFTFKWIFPFVIMALALEYPDRPLSATLVE